MFLAFKTAENQFLLKQNTSFQTKKTNKTNKTNILEVLRLPGWLAGWWELAPGWPAAGSRLWTGSPAKDLPRIGFIGFFGFVGLARPQKTLVLLSKNWFSGGPGIRKHLFF